MRGHARLLACVRSKRSPLHDVRQHARRMTIRPRSARISFSRTNQKVRRPASALLGSGATAFAVWPAKPKLRSSEGWWSQTGSNRRPPACKAGALPTELWPRTVAITRAGIRITVVGLGRLELPTSRLSSARSNQLSYKPKLLNRSTDRPSVKTARVRPRRKRNVDGGVPLIGSISLN